MIIGCFPQLQLAEARLKLQELKQIRELGALSYKWARRAKTAARTIITRTTESNHFTLKTIIDFYLTQLIEDHLTSDGKLIVGTRKLKSQDEVRRMLYADVVKDWGNVVKTDITRQDIIDLIMSIVEYGANDQAGNVLRELNAVYEFIISLGKINSSFINPVVLAKNSLNTIKFKLTSQKGKARIIWIRIETIPYLAPWQQIFW